MKGRIQKLKNEITKEYSYPVTVADAVYVKQNLTLTKKLAEIDALLGKGITYVIENARFGIKNDGTDAKGTTNGIIQAIAWAKANGYVHVYLTGGIYAVKVNLEDPSIVFDMPNDIHFEMASNCTIKLEGNSSPAYRIFNINYKKNVKISGGKLVGDKDTHSYEMPVKFVRGGVNANGDLNDNPNFIRSEIIDRKLNLGLLAFFRLWKMDKITATKYSFFQYRDNVSRYDFVAVKNDGGFAPASATGRGWSGTVEDCNKMVITIDITNSPLTDDEIANLGGKIDNMYYSHEGGHGIGIFASWNVIVDRVEISHCTGDGVMTGLGNHYGDITKYTYDDIGGNIIVNGCNIHHNRRQGISLCGPNDIIISNNNIHHIGYSSDNKTSDFRNGTAPSFGIDIESMVGEHNIPYEMYEYEKEGFQTNYRINIFNNYIHHNYKGHFVNCDGTDVTIENNTFEGTNIGAISSYPNYWYVKYINNNFIGCDLIVGGNNTVDGAVFYKGNLRGFNPKGANIENVHIREGAFSFSSVYGYFGSPTVNVETGTFTFPSDTGIGSGGNVCFEQWLGKVPTGIDVSKLYWTVNATARGFQVSETKGGSPVVIKDAGTAGFNISRFDYGDINVSNVTVEKLWKTGTGVELGFNVLATGGTFKDITIKNYDFEIKPPAKYVGRPISIQNFIVIEGGGNFNGCNILNADFMKIKAKRLGGDISFGTNNIDQTRKIKVKNASFQNVDVNLEGDVLMDGATFDNCTIGKSNGTTKSATLMNSYIENSKLYFAWNVVPNQVIIIKNTLKGTAKQLGAGVVFVQNLEIESILS